MPQAAAVDDDPLWRMRWALLASMIVVLAAVGLIVAMHHTHWNWALFIWGIAIGLAGLAIIAGVFRFVTRHHEPTPAQRIRLQRRLRIYTFCWLAAGLICGSVSATFDQAWIDIAVAAYVLITLAAGGLLIFRRRNSLASPPNPSS